VILHKAIVVFGEVDDGAPDDDFKKKMRSSNGSLIITLNTVFLASSSVNRAT
jgi:hypothetical protein